MEYPTKRPFHVKVLMVLLVPSARQTLTVVVSMLCGTARQLLHASEPAAAATQLSLRQRPRQPAKAWILYREGLWDAHGRRVHKD